MNLDNFIRNKKESILLEDIEIKGDITSKNDMTILGYVSGNIFCEQGLNITGALDAEIKARNVRLQSAEITGNICCDDELTIDFDSNVIGNIKSNDCTIDGKIKGNIVVGSLLHIQKNADIVGNIDAFEISFLQGAKVNGQLKMVKEGD